VSCCDLRNQDKLPGNREEADLFFCSVPPSSKVRNENLDGVSPGHEDKKSRPCGPRNVLGLIKCPRVVVPWDTGGYMSMNAALLSDPGRIMSKQMKVVPLCFMVFLVW